MDAKTAKLYRTAETRLIRRGFTSREQIDRVFDKHGLAGIDGCGPVLARLIEDALLLPNEEWCRLFPRIPTGRSTMPVELSTAPGSRVEWDVAERLTEGHSLTPPPPGDA